MTCTEQSCNYKLVLLRFQIVSFLRLLDLMFSELMQNRKKKPATILKKQQNKVEEKIKEISSKLMKNEQI